MNKNSINEVAKTYQRLVEAAPPTPIQIEPFEGPDQVSQQRNTPPSDTSDEYFDSLTFEYFKLKEELNNIRDTLEQCYSSGGTCTKEYLNLLEAARRRISIRMSQIERLRFYN